MTSPRHPPTFTVDGPTGEGPGATVEALREALNEPRPDGTRHDRARGFVLCPPWCRACNRLELLAFSADGKNRRQVT